MSAKSVATLLSRRLRAECSTSRALSTTRVLCLPRQVRPRSTPLATTSTSATPLSAVPTNTLSEEGEQFSAPEATSTESSEVPWFLEGEEDVEVLQAATSLPPSHSTWSPDASLPEPLATLHYLLAEGDCSALIARPDEEGGLDSVTGKKPITYIHAKAVDVDFWSDWIVVVQVKSNAGGSVSRVAKEVGSFLKHALPPALQPVKPSQIIEEEEEVVAQDSESVAAVAETEATSIDDFLGQPSEESSSQSIKMKNYRFIEQERNPSTTEFSKTKAEVEMEKRPWRPFKIISREAQDGLRALHADDPERWSRAMLAQTFRISPESVRRILKSKWRPTGQIVGRQNRRAMEREQQRRQERAFMSREEKEREEIDQIRKEMDRDNKDVDEDEQEYRLQGEEDYEDGGHRHTQPIFYEGLVESGGDDRRQGKVKSGSGRGDGEWCLVDAGWCVVHVMTAQARTMYDVESIASRVPEANRARNTQQ